MVCDWPTMPKRGAVTSTTRRSRSLRAPVISAWTGAVKPSAATSAGTSWTRPSVSMIAPATRSGGTSASAALSAENSSRAVGLAVGFAGFDEAHVEARDAAEPLGQRARAVSVCFVRSPKFWLGLLSTTTATTEDSGSRSSRVNDGLASASTIMASASAAHRPAAAPRESEQRHQHDRDARAPPTAHRPEPAARR